MDFFVKKNTKVEVVVYVWENDDHHIEATHEKASVPEKVEKAETISFYFRQPTYADSVAILRQAAVHGDGEVDFAEVQDFVLKTLLADWSIKDDQGQSVSVRAQAINNLQPAIARAAVAGCFQKVSLF